MNLEVNTIARAAVAELSVDDWARVCMREIVRAGGALVADSEGRSCYPTRTDVRIDHTVWDPHLRREVRVKARVRVTVEFEPLGEVPIA
jgi:hypothetical protein